MEYWNLYDKDRQKLNQIHKRGGQMPENTYHLVVHICVLNQAEQMLIQKRREDREVFPGFWDISAAGSATANENSAQAAQRELWEEIGLKHDFSCERPLLTVHFEQGFSDWYVIECDKEINHLKLQESEVSEVKWARFEEITRMKEEGCFIPYHDGFLEVLMAMHKKRGAHQ